MTDLEPYSLTALEVACGIVLGPAMSPLEQPPEHTGTPIAEFSRAVLEALKHPPCLVSFSGGRDSSAALAVATHVARSEGLPPPIPATNRFPTVGPSDEVEWQELVVAHLGIEDWFRHTVDHELDCVGPVATDVLRHHGLLWPFNAFFHVPLLQAARGGSLITGVGGDEVFGGSRWRRAEAVVAGTVRPQPRDALRIALALAPARLRAPILRHRLDIHFPWLRPETLEQVLDAWAVQDASEPFGWGKDFSWWRTLRSWGVAQRSLEVLATDAETRIVHPFADSGFAEALARLGKGLRFSDRSTAMEMLFGDVLPDVVTLRPSKASFDGAFFNLHSRRFLETWQGEGADPGIVDAEMLRNVWRGPEPDARSFLLLQSAWLTRMRDEAALHPRSGDDRSRERGLDDREPVEYLGPYPNGLQPVGRRHAREHKEAVREATDS
jgi:Asparagine synthase